MTLPEILFVGGPGRSGTSFVADRLGAHPEIAAFRDVELKLFCEKNGLLDLHHTLCERYSPNRGPVALAQFRKLAEALAEGRFGQLALGPLTGTEAWTAAIARFADRLCIAGHAVAQTEAAFAEAARGLLADIAALARAQPGREAARIFLEKTPHTLLAVDFLARIAPGARFLHVMRDPRSIAYSLLAMRWGPDRIEPAAEWVASYCSAWTRAEALAADRGIMIERLHIEDLSASPGAAAESLATWLDLGPGPELFRGASPEVLNRWTAKATAEERALLDQRLAGWVAHFGYVQDAIGLRPDGPSGRIAPAAAE